MREGSFWNVLYAEVLQMIQIEGIMCVPFADDLTIAATFKTEASLMVRTKARLQQINNWMTRTRLGSAPVNFNWQKEV